MTHKFCKGLETLMNVLDLTAAKLRAARDEGTTLAELAQQQGINVDALMKALIADAEDMVVQLDPTGMARLATARSQLQLDLRIPRVCLTKHHLH